MRAARHDLCAARGHPPRRGGRRLRGREGGDTRHAPSEAAAACSSRARPRRFGVSAVTPLYAIGKFGLRALSQCLAKAYAKDGVHVVHVRLDCDTLDVPLMRELYGDDYNSETLADPDAVAEAYWWAHRQPKSAWSNEIELRPHTESWTI